MEQQRDVSGIRGHRLNSPPRVSSNLDPHPTAVNRPRFTTHHIPDLPGRERPYRAGAWSAGPAVRLFHSLDERDPYGSCRGVTDICCTPSASNTW